MKANTIGLTLDTLIDFSLSLCLDLITANLAVANVGSFRLEKRNAIGPWLDRFVNRG